MKHIDFNEPVSPQHSQSEQTNEVTHTEEKRKQKRCVDMEKTLTNYMKRIKGLPHSSFNDLEGCWLSTFDIFSTIHADDLSSVSMFIFQNVPAVHLMLWCKQLGVHVRGVTSERKQSGRYICKERANPQNRVVFVGKYSYFSGSELAKQTSEFALKKSDYVYKPVCPSTDTFVYYI